MRQKAEELRATADQMTHPTSQESYRRLAATYDALADRAEGKDNRKGESEAG